MEIIKSKYSAISKNKNLINSFSFHKWSNELKLYPYFLQARISDYFDIISGFAFKSSDYGENGIKLLRIGDINKDGSINWNEMKMLPSEFQETYKRFLVKEKDIVIAMTGATVGKTGYISELKETLLLNQRVGILRAKLDITFIPKIFHYILKDKLFLKQVYINSMGKSQPNISPFDILNIKVPKIDYSIQEKIKFKIDELENRIKKLKSHIREPLQIINEVFADYYEYSPTLWKEFGKGMTAGTQKSDTRTLKYYKVKFRQFNNSKILRASSRFHNPITQKLTEILRSKSTIKIKDIVTEAVQRGKQPKNNPKGTVRAIKTAQLKNGYFDFKECDMVLESFYANSNRGKVSLGDILISSTGKVSLGKIDMVDFETDAIVDGHISIVRIDKQKYHSLFLVYFLRSLLGMFQIERDYTGATNQIELYSNEIENFEIPALSIEEQEIIALSIEIALEEQKKIKAAIDKQQLNISEMIKEEIKKV